MATIRVGGGKLRRVGRHLRANVIGYLGIFLALTGTAVALPGVDTVDSGDIINGEVKAPDIIGKPERSHVRKFFVFSCFVITDFASFPLVRLHYDP